MKNNVGLTCDSEPEYNSGKDTSIKAHYGSCSSDSCSDRNPSNSSLECPECVQQCDIVVDSNHSTYGSSGNHDSSDNTSYDSNVFWGGGAPDQMCTDLSSEKTSISEVSCLDNMRRYSDFNNFEEIGSCKNCDIKNSVSMLNLSELSGCDTADSLDSMSSKLNSCPSVDCLLNLSEISGLTEDSETSSSHKTCCSCKLENSETELCNDIPMESNTLPRKNKYRMVHHVQNTVNTYPKDRQQILTNCVDCRSRLFINCQKTGPNMSRHGLNTNKCRNLSHSSACNNGLTNQDMKTQQLHCNLSHSSACNDRLTNQDMETQQLHCNTQHCCKYIDQRKINF
ncbi:unnamed protein product [Mytilus coruscus]|uniref:Uncharacterized protein n=1 Tax=Mytilus coruscus TaxID=42192 RepID=A0A6J8EXX2_MYTCO|nr:unnamed protein product [Mytilus coruscus]